MKKQSICLALSLFLLTGCSGATANISNGNQTLFTVGNTKVTAQDEYNLTKRSNGGTMTIELAQRAVYDQIVPVTEEMKTAANEEYEELAGYYDDLEEQLKQLGYADKDDYINSVVVPEQQKDALMKKYFEDNKTAIRKQYKPVLARVIMCDSEDIAKEALEALKKGEDVQAVYDKYNSADSTFTNEDVVLTTLNENIPTRLVNECYAAEEKGVIDEVFPALDASTYAFVAILTTHGYDNNIDTFREEIASKSQTINTEMFVYYFNQLGFEVYDQEIFDYLKVNNPEYLIHNPELIKTEE